MIVTNFGMFLIASINLDNFLIAWYNRYFFSKFLKPFDDLYNNTDIKLFRIDVPTMYCTSSTYVGVKIRKARLF